MPASAWCLLGMRDRQLLSRGSALPSVLRCVLTSPQLLTACTSHMNSLKHCCNAWMHHHRLPDALLEIALPCAPLTSLSAVIKLIRLSAGAMHFHHTPHVYQQCSILVIITGHCRNFQLQCVTHFDSVLSGNNLQTRPMALNGSGAAMRAILESKENGGWNVGQNDGSSTARTVMARAARLCNSGPKAPPTLW